MTFTGCSHRLLRMVRFTGTRCGIEPLTLEGAWRAMENTSRADELHQAKGSDMASESDWASVAMTTSRRRRGWRTLPIALATGLAATAALAGFEASSAHG